MISFASPLQASPAYHSRNRHANAHARAASAVPTLQPAPCAELPFDGVIAPDSPAALLAALPDSVWRANQISASKARATPSGFAMLDRELPNGGWPASVLTELLLAQNGIGELRLLAPVLSALTQAGKSVILLAPPHIPFAPALAELGLDLRHVLVIQTDKPMDRIWAVEQTLKSASFGALLCWLPQARADHLRRLQLAAGGSEGLCFVFRPVAAQQESSPAPLRIVCRASSGGGMTVDIVKRRGPLFGQPMLLPLQVPPVLEKSFARRAAEAATRSAETARIAHNAVAADMATLAALAALTTPASASAATAVPSNTLLSSADHAVDCPEPAATAARYRPAVAA